MRAGLGDGWCRVASAGTSTWCGARSASVRAASALSVGIVRRGSLGESFRMRLLDRKMGAVAYDREVVLNTVDASSTSFDAFIADAQVRLRRAFVARYGIDLGVEACSESITWAYANRARLMAMTNPVGYLYRVGQTAVRDTGALEACALFPVEVADNDLPLPDGAPRRARRS